MTSARRPAPFPLWALAALGITQIVGYGTLYYSFALLAPGMARDLGWSEEWVFAALTGALIVGGLFAPTASRLADRFGAPPVMAFGSVAAAAALVLCATATGPVGYVAGLVAMELASAFVLYAAAFVAIVQAAGADARRRITHLTLIAGFASTVFWPLTSYLASLLDWREIYLVFAGLNLLVCLPLHLALLRARGTPAAGGAPAQTGPETDPDTETGSVPAERRGLIATILLVAMAVEGFVLGSILVHMVPLMAQLGLGADGAWIASLFGPAQVASRLVNMVFGQALRQVTLAAIAAGLPAAGLALLALTGSSLGAVGFAVLFGMGSGLISIVSGTVPLELFGRKGYGAAVGRLSAARQLAAALAPLLLAVLLARLGTVASLWTVTAAAALGFALFVLLARLASPPPQPETGMPRPA